MLNRGTKLIALATLMAAASACKTTGGNVANVDKARGEVELYSAGDSRTTLDDASKLEEVRLTEKKLKAHLRKNRDDVEALINLAQVQVVLGDLEGGEKNCKTALRKDLTNKEARKVLAQIAMRRQNYDLASIFLSGVGVPQSKDSGVLNMLALIELQKGNNSGAMALFKRAIKVNPTDLAARMNLGVLYLKYRQLAQAAVEFERVIKTVPNHTDAKLHLAIVKSARGEAAEAQDMLEEVLKEDATNPLALYNLAVVEKAQDKQDDALDHLQLYLKTAKGKPSDQDQVFALIDDIQKQQAAKGEKVSDEDIQAMAMAAQAPDVEEPKKVAQAEPAAPKAQPKTQPKAQPVAAKPAPKAQQEEFKLPEDDGEPVHDEVSDLENALKN